MMQNWRSILIVVFRYLLAAVFMLSGFTKLVDPWGGMILFREYFSAFGLGFLSPAAFPFAIWWPALEMALGVALLVGLALRFTSLLTMLSMMFFTVLTFVLALWNPVQDCGCFGEAIHLTNWQTFFKNLVILPMSVAVYMSARHADVRPLTILRLSNLVIIWVAVSLLGVYSYMHLPVIDFLPYKKGVNIPEAMATGRTTEVETTLIYRNTTTGETREFSLEDTDWYDTVRWEYVDTRIETSGEDRSAIRDFAIFGPDGDITAELLADTGRVWLICALHLGDISPEVLPRLEYVASRANSHGERVVCVTSDRVDSYVSEDYALPAYHFGTQVVPLYNMDSKAMITMLRARVGVVLLRGGTIIDKRNWRDIEMPLENNR